MYEVCIRGCPEAYSGKQFDEMSNRALRELVHQCLQTNLDDRPDMTEIIGKPKQFQEVVQQVMTETPGCLACPILRAHTTTQTAEVSLLVVCGQYILYFGN